jgi:hypothetical protein
VLLPDGTPAVGAAIGGPGSSGWTAADADGRYAVAVASREDCAEQPLWVLLPGYCAAGIGLFRVEPGADLRAEDLKLVADGVVVVRGRVVSRAGNEISSGQVGATIVTESRLIDTARRSRDPGPLLMLEAAWPGESRPSALSDFDTARRATVGAGGSFELRLPASLGVVTLFADVAGHASEWPGPRSVQEWAQREVELLVSPTRGIRGRVVDAVTGSPIEGAVVGEGAGAVKTDLEGTFDWAAGGGRGTWARVAARGYFVTNVSGPEGGDAITVKLWRRRTLAGTVRLADGSAVTGAFVAVVAAGSGQGSENARTDATGRFRFDEVRDGRLAVVVQPTPDSPSFLTKEFEDVAAGDMGLDLVVDPGLTVAGRIVDGDGRPVPRMHVVPLAVANESARRSGHIFSAVSGADGTFVVNGLPSGRHDLNVYDAFDEAGGWLPEMRKGVEAGTADLVVVVTKGLTISGRVTDGDGRPAFGKRVIADDVATNPLLGGFGNGPELDADGRFVLRGLRPGRYRLELGDVTNDPTRFQLAGGASVEAGAKDVALTLLDGGSIAGIVRDAAGEAVAGEWVTLLWTAADASGRNAQSDEKGRFEFRGLPLGHAYAVKARGALVRDVALGTHDVRLEVRPAEK